MNNYRDSLEVRNGESLWKKCAVFLETCGFCLMAVCLFSIVASMVAFYITQKEVWVAKWAIYSIWGLLGAFNLALLPEVFTSTTHSFDEKLKILLLIIYVTVAGGFGAPIVMLASIPK